MDLQKINVKFFSEEREPTPLALFIDIFHGWIQATDGVYHDVADYSHMQAGPGIVLVAQDAHVSIDETGGRRGLLFKQKARLEGSNVEKLRCVFRSASENCRKIEQESAVAGKLKFRADEAEITINDRLIAPNTEEGFLDLKTSLEIFLGDLYSGSTVFIQRNSDQRECLGVKVNASRRFDVATLLQKL